VTSFSVIAQRRPPHAAAERHSSTPNQDTAVGEDTARDMPRVMKQTLINVFNLNFSIRNNRAQTNVQTMTDVFMIVYSVTEIYLIDILESTISSEVVIPIGATVVKNSLHSSELMVVREVQCHIRLKIHLNTMWQPVYSIE
jgi:hypothetical protein